MLLSALLAHAAIVAADPVRTDPFASAAPGWLLCDNPDEAEKTCDSMTEVEIVAPGHYIGHVRMSAPGLRSLVLYDWHIEMIDGATCIPMRVEEYRNVRFVLNGRELTPAQAPADMAHFKRIFAAIGPNVRGCTTFFQAETGITAITELRKGLGKGGSMVLDRREEPLRWVHKDDGYEVTARRGAITTAQ